ncbi:MAG: hypothetical protein JO163_13840 [Methylobacteriaceae bacterium]|nr:hypothetical protein [Methylobacteriaceae bacterium]
MHAMLYVFQLCQQRSAGDPKIIFQVVEELPISDIRRRAKFMLHSFDFLDPHDLVIVRQMDGAKEVFR